MYNHSLIPTISPFSFPCISALGADPAVVERVKKKLIDLRVVSNYIGTMAWKWDRIGIQLHQKELVRNLQQPNLDNEKNLTQILQEAMESEEHPLTYGKLLAALRSRAVNLPQVANELLQDALDSEGDSELVQQATNGDQPPSRHSPPSAPTSASEKTPLLTHASSHA